MGLCTLCDGELPADRVYTHAACDVERTRRYEAGECVYCGKSPAVGGECGDCHDDPAYSGYPGGAVVPCHATSAATR